MKNLIIGYGETLVKPVEIKRGTGPKQHPYGYDEGLRRIRKDFEVIISDIVSKPEPECANGEVVVAFWQHPSYLAKAIIQELC